MMKMIGYPWKKQNATWCNKVGVSIFIFYFLYLTGAWNLSLSFDSNPGTHHIDGVFFYFINKKRQREAKKKADPSYLFINKLKHKRGKHKIIIIILWDFHNNKKKNVTRYLLHQGKVVPKFNSYLWEEWGYLLKKDEDKSIYRVLQYNIRKRRRNWVEWYNT